MSKKIGIAVICIVILGGGLIAYNVYDLSQRDKMFQSIAKPDNNDLTRMYTFTAPTSWTSTDGLRYYAPDNSATISFSVFSSSGEKKCESTMALTVTNLANTLKDFSSAPVSVVGATKAVSIKGMDVNEQNNIGILACGNNHTYMVNAIELNKNTPIPASVEDSLKTFTVTD